MKKFKVSKAAVAKVTGALPVPSNCPNCGAGVELVNNKEIYGREYGAWPFSYRCVSKECDSYVGIHPRTDIPLGTLANKEVRQARKLAKAVISPLWEERGIERTAVYRWLAEKMGIANVDHMHIGYFGVEQCNRVIQICKTNIGEIA